MKGGPIMDQKPEEQPKRKPGRPLVTGEQMVKCTVRVPLSVFAILRDYARETKQSPTEAMRDALTLWARENEAWLARESDARLDAMAPREPDDD